jgi:NADH:ubiquinone oxidoreductase subunit F (NADH-binding)
MSCHLQGADKLVKDLRQRTRIMGSEVSVKEVSCLGQCDRALAVSVNERIFSHATADSAMMAVSAAQANIEIENGDLSGDEPGCTHFSAVAEPGDSPYGQFASDPYPPDGHYGALWQLLGTRDFDAVIRTLKEAGLAGMGGAGFPTSIKWDTVRKAPGDQKYVVCNADESEPGTVKDRCIMECLPHLVIEGMIICGLVVGAKTGFLYIRHEYEYQQKILEEEIERCRHAGWLGENICGTGLTFDIEIFVSPGGYICGEGSALLEAIEGNRAEPRIRPPNSATHGLWKKPTALNNVETFTLVPQILARGVEWYKAQGLTKTAAGLKFVSVSGDVQRPGIFEIRMGTPASEVILNLAGGPPKGKKVKAFAPSGAASGFLPPSFLNVNLDFKSMAAAGTMLGSGAIVVCAEGRCMLDMALNSVKFFRNESCGKCVPCRMGSQKLVDLLTGWTQGRGKAEDIELIEALSETLKQTSICGLGQFIPYSILSVLHHFREETYEHVFYGRCPEGVCPMGSSV